MVEEIAMGHLTLRVLEVFPCHSSFQQCFTFVFVTWILCINSQKSKEWKPSIEPYL